MVIADGHLLCVIMVQVLGSENSGSTNSLSINAFMVR